MGVGEAKRVSGLLQMPLPWYQSDTTPAARRTHNLLINPKFTTWACAGPLALLWPNLSSLVPISAPFPLLDIGITSPFLLTWWCSGGAEEVWRERAEYKCRLCSTLGKVILDTSYPELVRHATLKDTGDVLNWLETIIPMNVSSQLFCILLKL